MRILWLLLLIISPWCTAQVISHGDYVLSHAATDYNQFSVRSSRYGQWRGFIGSGPDAPAPDGEWTHELQFTFWSPDYFTDANQGHIAVGLGGGYSSSHLQGRGVIIGNVSQWSQGPGCRHTLHINAVAIESFWRGGNCVMGWTSSAPLRNNHYYRLTISTTYAEHDHYVSYRLDEYDLGAGWRLLSQYRVFDYSANSSAGAGFFILEVFSTHAWTVFLSDVVERRRIGA